MLSSEKRLPSSTGETPLPDAPKDEAPLKNPTSYLCIRLHKLWLGLPVEQVEEICSLPKPTPLPGAPAYIPGLITLRGQALPLLDAATFWGLVRGTEGELGATEGDSDFFFKRIVVLFAEGMRVGLICDHVRGVWETDKPEDKSFSFPDPQVGQFFLAALNYRGKELFVVDVPKLIQATRVKGV